jgi:preprotein translocase subunit SecB
LEEEHPNYMKDLSFPRPAAPSSKSFLLERAPKKELSEHWSSSQTKELQTYITKLVSNPNIRNGEHYISFIDPKDLVSLFVIYLTFLLESVGLFRTS